MFGAREGRIRIAGRLDEMRGEIIGHVSMHERRAVLQRAFHVHLDRKMLVFDLDQRGRVLGGIAVDCNDHRDGLADVIHVAARQRPLRLRVFHRRMRNEQRHRHVERADIVASIDRGDARIISGGADVDCLDPRTGYRAAQEGGMQRIGQRNVVDKGAFAAQQLRIDIAFNAGAECACRHGRSVRRGREARRRAVPRR